MIRKYPSKKRCREKRPRQKPDNLKTLGKIIKKQGKLKSKFHRFLQERGDEFLYKLDDYYSPETYGEKWIFDNEYMPRPILEQGNGID